jgi:hypothetical protein
MSTPQLAITHVAAAQNQKEVACNDAFDQIDNADMAMTQTQLASGGCIVITLR